MNSISQRQQNPTLQIAGIIQNYRTIITRTAKPMATFVVGGFSAKCFDVVVDTAEYWATTGKKVLVSGHLSSHDGTIELVAQSINLAPAGQAETGFSEGGDAYISVQGQASIRETSSITENLSGNISNLKTVSTRSGRPMITFKIGTILCKAFGELASAIHKAEGKHIEISGRKGCFRGVTEYTVETLKMISGTAVNLRDDSNSLSPTAGPARHRGSLQQQNQDSVAPYHGERTPTPEDIAKPKAGPLETDNHQSSPGFDKGDEELDFWENWVPKIPPSSPSNHLTNPVCKSEPEAIAPEPKPEPAKLMAAITTEVKPVKEIKISPQPVIESTRRNEETVGDWIHRIESDSFAYLPETVKRWSLESGDRGEAARRVLAQRRAEQAPETTEATGTALAEQVVIDKLPEVQGVLRKIRNCPTKDGRKLVFFDIGPFQCYLQDTNADFLETHASEFEGKLIELYGEWGINERGRVAFLPEERIVATDPPGEVTVDKVQKEIVQALFVRSELASVGGPTYDEMKAEYEERKKSEQQAKSSAVAP
jgi:hypothetical protein